jgi:hypothetical protein
MTIMKNSKAGNDFSFLTDGMSLSAVFKKGSNCGTVTPFSYRIPDASMPAFTFCGIQNQVPITIPLQAKGCLMAQVSV